MNADYKRELAWLLAVAAIVLLAGIGLRDPWPADEPRFALIALEMAEGGNWLFPHVGGVLYPDKPPLFFWLVAALYLLVGSLRIAILVPGVIAGLGVLLLVTDLGRRLWDPRTGILCGAALLATLQFPLQMKSGQIDGLLCLWTTLGLYGFCRHLLLGPDWRWYAIGGVAAGLGIITKGVGFLPYLVFVPYFVAAIWKWTPVQLSWRDLRWFVAPLATLFVIGAWLVPMLVASSTGGDPSLQVYRDNILFHQTVTRYSDAWGHIKPAWYLLTNAASWLWLPLTLMLPWLVPAWRQDLKRRDASMLLLLGWIVLVLAFFSLSAGKRSLYIFPAAPAFALVAGYHARGLLDRPGIRRVLVAVPAVIALAMLAAGFYAVMNPHTVEEWLVNVATILQTSAALIVTGLAMLVAVAWHRSKRAVRGYATAMIALWLGVSFLVAPAVNGVRSGAALVDEVQKQVPSYEQLAFVAWPEQFLLYWDRPVTHFGYRRRPEEELPDAAQWLSAAPQRRLLLPARLLAPCFDPREVSPVGRAHRRDWVVADPSALTAECGAVRAGPGRQTVSQSGDGAVGVIDRSARSAASSRIIGAEDGAN